MTPGDRSAVLVMQAAFENVDADGGQRLRRKDPTGARLERSAGELR